MEAQVIALLIVVPFTLVFIYAIIHEYSRYKRDGRAKYGLVYDEETGTTHVTGIADDEDGYDPVTFDPNDHNEQKTADESNDEKV